MISIIETALLSSIGSLGVKATSTAPLFNVTVYMLFKLLAADLTTLLYLAGAIRCLPIAAFVLPIPTELDFCDF